MRVTDRVREVLSYYDGERPGVKASLARLLMHGRTAGSGKLVILPVDQGFEHGPGRSFAANPAAYDPRYVFELAIEAGLSALAAPLGLLAAGADRYPGEIPLILKANNANSLGSVQDEAITGTVRDALELGCSAVGYTVYPGSDRQYEMFEEIRAATAEAKANGLAVIVWAYPRGGMLDKDGETALDVVAYGAHIAALLGAHIIKVKPPTAHIAQKEAKAAYDATGADLSSLPKRIAHVVQAAFDGRRIVIFSGGPARGDAEVLDEVRAIHAGGGFGSIVGRNAFQRPRAEALALLDGIIRIHLGEF
ncbi:MAG: class I fructose-bisphosphate aldolase [Devosia nanyangense]|uniref:fructose-bisphosphate aldolase n=1 Tax=Devosia nanyangense TaxID=1228055 RepID=A0A933L815_9HYPH|nr:class I fructose-bisphosphate aldolase [Devosia nanyangense]